MSNEVKRAIDTGLCGLYVTGRDVDVILRRVRTEAVPAREKPRARVRMSAVLALAMMILVLGVTITMVRQGRIIPENTPLTQQTGNHTTMDEASWKSVIDRAEAYVRAEHDPAAALRNERLFTIECMEQNGLCIVYFRALNEYETEYTVTVDPVNYAVTDCRVQRGVGDGHTAEEIHIGYGRVYGSDWRLWTQEQLNTYAGKLRKADTATLRWNDLLTLQTGYAEVRENALPKEQIAAAILAPLGTAAPAYVNGTPLFENGTVWQVLGEPRLHYLNAAPNPVWKAAVDLWVVNPEGYASQQVLLVEADSVTGAFHLAETASVWAAEEKEMHLQATIDAMQQVNWSVSEMPLLAEDEALDIARRYVYASLGATGSLSDPAQYTVTIDNADFGIDGKRGSMYSDGVAWKVLFMPVSSADPAYCVYVGFFGEVVAAGATDPQQMNIDELRYRASNGWAMPSAVQVEYLQEMQSRIVEIPQDELARLLAETGFIRDLSGEFYSDIVCRALNLRTASVTYPGNMRILADGRAVQKIAVESDKGNFLAEVDVTTKELISAVRVEKLYDPWYAPYLLQADMEAAGIAPAPYSGDVSRGDVADSGIVMGMWIKHIYERYQSLYGYNLYNWTPAQLRAFREDAVLSCDIDGDMGVMCLRSTYFPDVPEGAITREAAAKRAEEALGLTGCVFEGAALIGSDGTPVWKVCLRRSDGRFTYAEVNCMTGMVGDTYTTQNAPAGFAPCYDDNEYDEYWYRDIVLEQTIEECEGTWDRKSNG